MRCGCPECGAFMIQSESGSYLGCRCPDCGYACDACMGTDTVLSRAELSEFRSSGLGRLSALEHLAEEDAALDAPEVTEETWMNDCLNG